MNLRPKKDQTHLRELRAILLRGKSRSLRWMRLSPRDDDGWSEIDEIIAALYWSLLPMVTMEASPRQPGLPLAAFALVTGIGIGWISSTVGRRLNGGGPSCQSSNNNDATTTDNICTVAKTAAVRCECGFDLTGISPEHVERHRAGRQHAYNLHRSSGVPILVTGKINEYRSAISRYALPSDVILEVGCAEGLTTQRLAQRCRVAIGIDQNETLIDKGKARLAASSKIDRRLGTTPDWSNLHLFAGDAFDLPAVIRIIDEVLSRGNIHCEATNKNGKSTTKHRGKVTKIWLDISGSRRPDIVVQLVRLLEGLLEPDLIVVKSHHLKNLVLRSHLPNSDIPGIPANHDDKFDSYVLA